MKTPHENFAAFFQALRKENRITLRAFCELADADPGNISRMSELGVSVHFLSFVLKSSKKLHFYFKNLFLQNSSV
jgi:hypothetical protein